MHKPLARTATGIAACQKTVSGWRANRGGHVEVGKKQPLFSHLIDPGGMHISAHETQGIPALIIGDNKNDIGLIDRPSAEDKYG